MVFQWFLYLFCVLQFGYWLIIDPFFIKLYQTDWFKSIEMTLTQTGYRYVKIAFIIIYYNSLNVLSWIELLLLHQNEFMQMS